MILQSDSSDNESDASVQTIESVEIADIPPLSTTVQRIPSPYGYDTDPMQKYLDSCSPVKDTRPGSKKLEISNLLWAAKRPRQSFIVGDLESGNLHSAQKQKPHDAVVDLTSEDNQDSGRSSIFKDSSQFNMNLSLGTSNSSESLRSIPWNPVIESAANRAVPRQATRIPVVETIQTEEISAGDEDEIVAFGHASPDVDWAMNRPTKVKPSPIFVKQNLTADRLDKMFDKDWTASRPSISPRAKVLHRSPATTPLKSYSPQSFWNPEISGGGMGLRKSMPVVQVEINRSKSSPTTISSKITEQQTGRFYSVDEKSFKKVAVTPEGFFVKKLPNRDTQVWSEKKRTAKIQRPKGLGILLDTSSSDSDAHGLASKRLTPARYEAGSLTPYHPTVTSRIIAIEKSAVQPAQPRPYSGEYGFHVGETVWSLEHKKGSNGTNRLMLWPVKIVEKIVVLEPTSSKSDDEIVAVPGSKALQRRKGKQSQSRNARRSAGSGRSAGARGPIAVYVRDSNGSSSDSDNNDSDDSNASSTASRKSDPESVYLVPKTREEAVKLVGDAIGARTGSSNAKTMASVSSMLKKRFTGIEENRFEYIVEPYPLTVKKDGSETPKMTVWRRNDDTLVPFLYSKCRPTSNEHHNTAILAAIGLSSSWAVSIATTKFNAGFLHAAPDSLRVSCLRLGCELVQQGDMVCIASSRRNQRYLKITGIEFSEEMNRVWVHGEFQVPQPNKKDGKKAVNPAEMNLASPALEFKWVSGDTARLDGAMLLSRYYPRFHELKGRFRGVERFAWAGTSPIRPKNFERKVQIDGDEYDGFLRA